jgi:uncharacterized membrane protein
MPNLASFHPQIVHFVVGLLLVGVALRIVSLTRRLRFTDHAALTLLLIGTVSAALAVKSGTDAHGPVERIPGTRNLVIEHEEDGEKTRNIFFVVAAIELVAFGLARRTDMLKYVRVAHVASALVGVFGAMELYDTAEHGGELVYSYGGGPGLRTGDPKDVERLLLAGLYNQSRNDRRAGRGADAAILVNEMARRFPNDTNVQFLKVESLLMDAKDYRGAMSALEGINVPANDPRLGTRRASMKADIYLAMGMKDSARATLASAVTAFPQNTRLKARLDSLK